MKITAFSILLLLFIACNNKTDNPTAINKSTAVIEDTTANYFAVTNFIKGDINSIKTNAPTPLHYTTISGKTDSVFVNMDSLLIVFKDFIEPRIDTANLKKYFSEKSFLDETLGAFTFSYDRRANSTFDFAFKNWDVLIDKETEKIKRIYLVKKIDATTTKQLTWIAEKYCKIVTITKDKVVKEEKIIWDFKEQ